MEDILGRMFLVPCLCGLFLLLGAESLSLRKDQAVVKPKVPSSVNDDCDPSTVPVLSSFDIKKFSGSWYELAKSASGYLDVDDGMWKIFTTNTSSSFLFSGRDSNGHCIRPIKGTMHAVDQPPGLLKLSYKTYSTYVEETIRVLFTDYTTVAVVYTCMHHVHHEKEACHAAGIMGAVWTRSKHVDLEVFEHALTFLEMACVHKSVLSVRNMVGPCIVDDLGFRIDDFPVPDFCYQPVDLGSCRGHLQRYFFDSDEKKCKTFIYGGCHGNRNNFMSEAECEGKCVSSSKEPICMSVAKCGIHCSPCCTEDRHGCVECNCDHIIEDNFLNCEKSADYCQIECSAEEFYPGCYVCNCHEEKPIVRETPACLEVKSEGNCEDHQERFYYDVLTETCEKFVYTGCGGNNNNFVYLKECQEKCQVLGYSAPRSEFEQDHDDDSSPNTNVINQWMTSILLIKLIIDFFEIL